MRELAREFIEMPIFYEFKIFVADKEEIDQATSIGYNIDWESADCVIDLDKIWGFYPDTPDRTKLLFGDDRIIVNCKYEDIKELMKKHYGIYPEK